MREYPKIPGPFRRHTDGVLRNKVIIGDWTSPELEYLQDAGLLDRQGRRLIVKVKTVDFGPEAVTEYGRPEVAA